MKKWFFLMAFVVLAACQSQPDYVLEEDQMIDLLTEVHMAEGLIYVQKKQMSDDAEYGQQIIAAVLEKKKVSKAEYDSSLVWYSQHLNSLIRIYKHVNENLKERHQEWLNQLAESGSFALFPSGDDVSLWNLSDYCLLEAKAGQHHREWVLKTDSTFRAGDTIVFTLHVPDMPAGQGLVASLSLVKDDATPTMWLVCSGATSTLLTSDTLLTLTCAPAREVWYDKVVATLHLLGADSTALTPCVVDGLDLRRKR